MIRAFADKEAEKNMARHAIPEIAATLDDLQVPPANRLEVSKGGHKGQHDIRTNNQWRICFQWKEGDALDVGIVDDH
jgi:proteic killer suppression protein